MWGIVHGRFLGQSTRTDAAHVADIERFEAGGAKSLFREHYD